MCTTCGAKTYGQHQPEARAADKAKLDAVRAAREAKVKQKGK